MDRSVNIMRNLIIVSSLNVVGMAKSWRDGKCIQNCTRKT
jgi:hypothetical protein